MFNMNNTATSWIRVFSIPEAGCRVKKISDPGSGSASKNLSILTHNIVSKLKALGNMILDGSRIRSLDADLDFYPSRIRDPGVKKAPDPGSGSATHNVPY
jgi:hypothetical protein